MRSATVLLALALTLPAAAAEPTVQVRDDGTVVGDVTVSSTPDRIRALISDPVAAGKMDPDVLSTQVRPKGECVEIERQTRGAWNPLEVRSLRCPTSTGYVEKLVESDDFNEFFSEWELSAVEGGTRIRYSVRTEVNLPVPSSMVRSNVKKNMKATLKQIVEKVTP